MKIRNLLLTIPILFLIIGVGGCKEEPSEIDLIGQKLILMKQNLIGDWEWIETYSSGAIGRITAETSGYHKEMIITDSTIVTIFNDEIIQDDIYVLEYSENKKNGEDMYYITFISKDPYVSSNKVSFVIKPTLDSLVIGGATEAMYLYSVYKKISNYEK